MQEQLSLFDEPVPLKLEGPQTHISRFSNTLVRRGQLDLFNFNGHSRVDRSLSLGGLEDVAVEAINLSMDEARGYPELSRRELSRLIANSEYFCAGGGDNEFSLIRNLGRVVVLVYDTLVEEARRAYEEVRANLFLMDDSDGIRFECEGLIYGRYQLVMTTYVGDLIGECA